MGEFPSGQRGQTVNLLAMPSVVRIHLPPPSKSTAERRCFCLVGEGIRFDPLAAGDCGDGKPRAYALGFPSPRRGFEFTFPYYDKCRIRLSDKSGIYRVFRARIPVFRVPFSGFRGFGAGTNRSSPAVSPQASHAFRPGAADPPGPRPPSFRPPRTNGEASAAAPAPAGAASPLRDTPGPAPQHRTDPDTAPLHPAHTA